MRDRSGAGYAAVAVTAAWLVYWIALPLAGTGADCASFTASADEALTATGWADVGPRSALPANAATKAGQ